VPEFGAAGDEHAEGADPNEGGGAEVLDDDEEADEDDGDKGEEEACEFVEIDGTAGEEPGEEDDDSPFAEFGGLELGDAEWEPAAGTVDGDADVGDQDGGAGEEGDEDDGDDGVEDGEGAVEFAVVEMADDEIGEEGDDGELGVLGAEGVEVPGGVAGDGHGGGLDHDTAERQERKYNQCQKIAKAKMINGEVHGRVYRTL
jgi:hypothetical protein